mmetsp:Transcript_30989/g.82345  ORF Transcript_30989/g.82345 Transcript_30989/m.82345 type:complete len:252 (+) Transcript_30989:988-1743(+)
MHAVRTVCGNGGVAVQQSRPRQHHVVERETRIVQVISDGFGAHVLLRHTRNQRALSTKLHEESVWSQGSSIHNESGHDHGHVSREPLRNPYLLRIWVGTVEDKRAPGVIPLTHRVHHEATVHASKSLGETEASKSALRLHVVQTCHLVLVAQGKDRAREEVELDGETNAEARAHRSGILGKDGMRHEEAFRCIAKVCLPEHAHPQQFLQFEGTRGKGVKRHDVCHRNSPRRLPLCAHGTSKTRNKKPKDLV